MAEFAPVAPIQVLEEMYQLSPKMFGEYHLLLAHHTAEKYGRFIDLSARIAMDGEIHPLIIMDNSVVECGGYVNEDMMKDACSPFFEEGHQIIAVLPDVMGNGGRTREAVAESYRRWELNVPCCGFMAVCQGESMQDYEISLRTFANRARYPNVEFLGVPRILVEKVGSRVHATQMALKYASHAGMKVHLLGYSDDMFDDLTCSRIAGVHGIDSAVPLRVDTPFDFAKKYPPRPKDWFEVAKLSPIMRMNLEAARRAHAYGLSS
jgi:hypothetical protein